MNSELFRGVSQLFVLSITKLSINQTIRKQPEEEKQVLLFGVLLLGDSCQASSPFPWRREYRKVIGVMDTGPLLPRELSDSDGWLFASHILEKYTSKSYFRQCHVVPFQVGHRG